MISLSKSILLLVAIAIPLFGHSSPSYQTKDFNTKSEASSVYKCAVIGVKTGLEPKAILYLNAFEALSRIEAKMTKSLLEDAYTWLELEGSKVHLKAMWRGGCEKPFSRLAQLTNEDDDLATSATIEQIGTGTCAYQVLPSEAKATLLAETKKYLTTSDQIKYTEAWQVNAVPESIAKCLDSYGFTTYNSSKNMRSKYHFLDMAERSMRFRFLEEVMRSQGATSKQLKKLKDGEYESFLKMNLEHY